MCCFPISSVWASSLSIYLQPCLLSSLLHSIFDPFHLLSSFSSFSESKIMPSINFVPVWKRTEQERWKNALRGHCPQSLIFTPPQEVPGLLLRERDTVAALRCHFSNSHLSLYCDWGQWFCLFIAKMCSDIAGVTEKLQHFRQTATRCWVVHHAFCFHYTTGGLFLSKFYKILMVTASKDIFVFGFVGKQPPILFKVLIISSRFLLAMCSYGLNTPRASILKPRTTCWTRKVVCGVFLFVSFCFFEKFEQSLTTKVS